MTAPNNNYVVGVSEFGNTQYFEADSIAPFNQAGDFAFGCMFWITGGYQGVPAGAAIQNMFLWGNELGKGGWSLRIVNGTEYGLGGASGEAWLIATIGDGAGGRSTAAVRLGTLQTDQNVGTPPGFIGQLIHACGMYDATGQYLYLIVNGSIVSAVEGVVYAPSLTAPRMGFAPDNADFAEWANIVGVAFSGGASFTLQAPPNAAGVLASDIFASARGELAHSYLSARQSVDWTHRWEAGSVGANVNATILKSAEGSIAVVLPEAPATIPDVGSAGAANKTLFAPVPDPIALNDAGVRLKLWSEKNPVWYSSAAWGQTALA